jgi:hypothetical protein
MGSLTTATDSDVANSNDWHVETATLQYANIEQRVPKVGRYAVKPAQRQQPFVDFDEVAFHIYCFEMSMFRNYLITMK